MSEPTTVVGDRLEGRTEQRSRLEDGITFASLDIDDVNAIWGSGSTVVWSRDEPFMIYGPQGVGKTTLGQRLVLGLVGVEPTLLGLPITPIDGRVLYIAGDRPRQARRSWRRMIATLGPEAREVVRGRLNFWPGPLPFDLGVKPDQLRPFVAGFDALVVDSLKDVAFDLVKDEVGSRVNHAWQTLVADGIQVLDLHHPRKGQVGKEARPEHLDEVYGSGWLTAGHGSVVSIWGNPGDPIVRLRHLKQPAEEVGPFELLLDHDLGMIELVEGVDLSSILARSGPQGLMAADAAKLLFSTNAPTTAQVEKARRRLETLVEHGRAMARRAERPKPTTYVAATVPGALE